jgi:hypothetical protein
MNMRCTDPEAASGRKNDPSQRDVKIYKIFKKNES